METRAAVIDRKRQIYIGMGWFFAASATFLVYRLFWLS